MVERKRRTLTQPARAAVEPHGYILRTYQVTKWFAFMLLPVIPLGTCRIERKITWSDEPRHLTVRIGWDWRQIVVHYLIAYGSIAALILLAVV